MKRTFFVRLLAVASVLLLLLGACTLSVLAADQTEAVTVDAVTAETEGVGQRKNPTNEELGGFFSAERIKYAITVTGLGMFMVFAVLSVLWGIVTLMKVFLHDIPAKRAAKKKELATAVAEAAAPAQQPTEALPVADEDEGEIVAAITAAIAATLASEEYKGQFASGFRVVSFSRKGGAWNKEN